MVGDGPESIGGDHWPDVHRRLYTSTRGRDEHFLDASLPNSFAALGIPLVAGRDFGPQDIEPVNLCPPPTGRWVGIINESMARRFYGNENPIGRRFGFAHSGARCCGSPSKCYSTGGP